MPARINRTNGRGSSLTRWYEEYWAQTWYKNTFLVQYPHQIAKAKGKHGDWNNIYDSGCNFTCLAMIVGIDPARLASLLSSQTYFLEDRNLPAKYLSDTKGGLVWDRNAPEEELPSVVLNDVWHPRLQRRTSIAIDFVQTFSTRSYAEGKRLVAMLRGRGSHIICGPEEHSHLVAGNVGASVYVWDPDDTQRSVEDNLAGCVTLRRLFEENRIEPIEFWEYRVAFG